MVLRYAHEYYCSKYEVPIPLQLLDRCLKIVDPELYAYLRSKNLSAEIYAFPCACYPYHPRINLLILPSGPHVVRMHTAPGPGPPTMGLLARFRCPPKRALRHRPATSHAR